MPRKTYRRKKTYRKQNQPWFKNANSAYKLAVRAAKDIWYLKGLVNSEMLHRTNSGSTTSNSTGTLTLLNGFGQDDTASGRTGNSVLMRNVLVRLVFTQHPTAISTQYRVMIVLDTQQISDTNPSVTDILESANPLSTLKVGNAGRFKILKSWMFTTDDDKGQTKVINYYKDMRMHTRFNGIADTDIQKNGIYLVTICNQATNTPTFDYYWKVGYHDN